MLEKEEPKQEDDLSLDNFRVIGVVDGIVDVEKLDTDSDDFYKGYCDGINAAYEVIHDNPEFNCPHLPTCNCDKSIPCISCENAPAPIDASDDYMTGYDAGYRKGEIIFRVENKEEKEELDELHCIGTEEEFDEGFFENSYDVWYDYGRTEGLMQGRDIGYEYGFEKGYEEAEKNVREYNVVLSGEFLAEVKELSNKILSYQKKGEKDHNFMLYDINHALMNVVESWAMEQIYDFWSSSCEDDDDEEDEIE